MKKMEITICKTAYVSGLTEEQFVNLSEDTVAWGNGNGGQIITSAEYLKDVIGDSLVSPLTKKTIQEILKNLENFDGDVIISK